MQCNHTFTPKDLISILKVNCQASSRQGDLNCTLGEVHWHWYFILETSKQPEHQRHFHLKSGKQRQSIDDKWQLQSLEDAYCRVREAILLKKRNFMKSQTGRGGQPDFISLIQNYIHVLRNTVKFLNKDLIKAVRGWGVTVLWNFFMKFRFF